MLYELPSFDYVAPKSIPEAVFLVHKHGAKAGVIAGGTDLLGLMKDRVTGPALRVPEILINIRTIPELNRINDDDEHVLRIGAAVTLNCLEASEVIGKKFPALLQAAQQVGTTQLRNMGTLGGNLCQRPRCMYFRHPHFPCFKKGGKQCYAISGEHRYYHAIMNYGKCVMTHPSDLAPALIALRAKVIISSTSEQKQIPIEDFYQDANPSTETILKPDELLTEIQIPIQKGRTYQLFLKHRIRHSSDFALSSIAVVARISHEVCEDIRVVLGGVAPFPYIVSPVEDLLQGKKKDEELISKAVEISVEGARPLPMNRYKIDLTKALVKRVLTSLWQESAQA